MQFCENCGTYLSLKMVRRESAPLYVCSKCGSRNEIKEKIRGRTTVNGARSTIECFSGEAKKLYERYRKGRERKRILKFGKAGKRV